MAQELLCSQTPCRGNITRSTMFTVFENAMGPVTPHLTLVRSNRLEEGVLADRTEVGGCGSPALIRNGFRVGPFYFKLGENCENWHAT